MVGPRPGPGNSQSRAILCSEVMKAPVSSLWPDIIGWFAGSTCGYELPHSPRWLSWERTPLPAQETRVLIPESGRSPGEGNGNPLSVFLPGKSHGQRSQGASPWGRKESDTAELMHVHRSLTQVLALRGESVPSPLSFLPHIHCFLESPKSV